MTVHIGFIGVGGMAEHHIKTFENIEGAKVSAVFDINQERSQEVANKYGATSYESAEDLIENSNVQGIYICTPPFARDGLEQAAITKGIHLLVEKPVALDMEKVWTNAKLAEEAGIIHTSGYCLRYLDIVQEAKEYLKDKQVDLIIGDRIGGHPPATWWGKMALSGGQLVEQSTHQLDLIRYLAGEFEEVYGVFEQRHMKEIDPDADAYDVGVFTFKMKSGAAGTFNNSSLVKYKGRGEVQFYGKGFYVSLKGAELTIVDDEREIKKVSRTNYVLEQDQTFVDAIRYNDPSRLLGDYVEAAKTLEVTLAVNESAATGKPITLK